ncbi:Copine I [Spironucleus salmonicida]|uniref:Copine I n=1 Tax=Spironucleus salmonicida TaxID=348837 RepID=V6LML7_9EUKA|nr:Copine I [Spironucleus salmonicida]|eukprot:EST44956.1 Copine I [Spironucleus salmonicida]
MGSSKSSFTTLGSPIPDRYQTYDQLQRGLKQAGIESLQSVFFFDFSKSNTWTGEKTYQGRSLHDISFNNPYMHAMDVMKPLIYELDDDGILPAFKFGCLDTKDRRVLPLMFPIQQDPHFAGIHPLKEAYQYVAQTICMSGPTTFAPAIQQSIEISQAYNNKQHLFIIIMTDGDVSDMQRDKIAIIEASNYPISFCALGFGDGPFEKMKYFDDMKGRKFDNFQFVNFTKLEKQCIKSENPELILATAMMQEIPDQFKSMKKLGYFQ